ncbi:MAG: hypothetical protein A3F68_10690 [Acidobacteria bacterium RIFCSPLOWO2_12_FULL_54_10]|nr:MAG: hypothetical protein A3F68_10690 [Acidobacteria bacterium RIFCSPLOWO2_12_FULL_54_10]
MRMNRNLQRCLGIFMLGAVLWALPIANYAAQVQTLEGTVTDASCGMKHKMADAKACTLACAKNGGYALVVGDKVYKLEGKEADIAKLAGEKAKVTGTVDGMTVKVSSIAAAGAGMGSSGCM